MRRDRRDKSQGKSFKHLLILFGGILLILTVTFISTFVSYNNKLKSSAESLKSVGDIVSNEVQNNIQTSEEASSSMGKTIDEAIKELESINNGETGGSAETINNLNTNNQNTVSSENTEPNTNNNQAGTGNTVQEVVEKPKEPEFVKPVEGEVLRKYAKDTLAYSETLQEWVVHLGLDIKAERTTVVKSSEAGKVISIKNDPRYGLTITVEHSGGFKTVYSNLLTTEFVSEGENVEKGQSLGTVGNSAAFEIVDEPHLHFEILKDDVNLDPEVYFK